MQKINPWYFMYRKLYFSWLLVDLWACMIQIRHLWCHRFIQSPLRGGVSTGRLLATTLDSGTGLTLDFDEVLD